MWVAPGETRRAQAPPLGNRGAVQPCARHGLLGWEREPGGVVEPLRGSGLLARSTSGFHPELRKGKPSVLRSTVQGVHGKPESRRSSNLTTEI